MEKVLRRLMPRGRAWVLVGDEENLITGLGATLERPRSSAYGVIGESRPSSAVLMLPEWCAALGIKYDPTLPVATLQARLDAIITFLGDLTLNGLNEQMHKELPEVDIVEVVTATESSICGEVECGAEECNSITSGLEMNPYKYLVYGTVANDDEAARVMSVLQHFAPLHLAVQSSLVILSDSGTTEAGIGICGIEECGNDGS